MMKLFSKIAPSTNDQAPSPETKSPGSRGYTVGWLLSTDKTSIIWDAPKRVGGDAPKNPVTKSVTQCPAVLDFDRRYFVINSPIDLHLRLSITNGELGITNLLFDKSPIRPDALQRMVVFQPQPEWRHPDRPVLQMLTSYVFVSDDPVYINQYPPFLHYSAAGRPGCSDQRPLPDRYLAPLAAMGVRMARLVQGSDPQAWRAAVLCPFRRARIPLRRCA